VLFHVYFHSGLYKERGALTRQNFSRYLAVLASITAILNLKRGEDQSINCPKQFKTSLASFRHFSVLGHHPDVIFLLMTSSWSLRHTERLIWRWDGSVSESSSGLRLSLLGTTYIVYYLSWLGSGVVLLLARRLLRWFIVQIVDPDALQVGFWVKKEQDNACL